MWFEINWKDWVVGRKSTCGNPLDFHCHKFLICIRSVRKLAHKACYLRRASERRVSNKVARSQPIFVRPWTWKIHENWLWESQCTWSRILGFLTWWDGHVGVQNNGKMHNNIDKFPKDLSLLFCFCTSTWPPWRHVKTESKFQDNTVNDNEHDDDNINFCLFDSLQSASA